jgi:uncharacterized protein (TIGR00730 family)
MEEGTQYLIIIRNRITRAFPIMKKFKIKTVAVYCGSSVGIHPVFSEKARELAEYFVDNDIRLINGGGSIGLMGIMADRMLELGGTAVGVIPYALKEKEVAHTGMTELIVVPDMHSRKMTIVNLSDAFIAIPGGYGTLDELFETLTWSQLHIHNKPIGILNVEGYFNDLVKMADKMLKEGFLKSSARELLHISKDIPTLFALLGSERKMSEEKWT